MRFLKLSEPIALGREYLKNRIIFGAHDTNQSRGGRITDDLVAYYEARAANDVAMIVIQAGGIHKTARYIPNLLMLDTDDCIPGLAKVAESCHRYDCRAIGQLHHPGRVWHRYGLRPVAPSAGADDWGKRPARAMSDDDIAVITQAYADAARRCVEAGLDGIEIFANHGGLPSQFLNAKVNRRTDRYGGDFDNRARFGREVIAAIRGAMGARPILGPRVSVDEMDAQTVEPDEVGRLCQHPDLDYVSATIGNEQTVQGRHHVVPPMEYPSGYTVPYARRIKAMVSVPTIVIGRMNDPAVMDRAIADGSVDICGAVRALICDAAFARKATTGAAEAIRACIGCNQACIGGLEKGLTVSCIQSPESGFERSMKISHAVVSKRVLVIGGGPAGMMAAATCHKRGHVVTLVEQAPHLGGQIGLAQLLPGRQEFGGVTTNLQSELKELRIDVRLKTCADEALLAAGGYDVVILATGASSYLPEIEGSGTLIDAWALLRDGYGGGKRVAVADWASDLIGPGIAELLVRAGCDVSLMIDNDTTGARAPLYVRDVLAARLHRAGVTPQLNAQIFGIDGRTVYFKHSVTGDPIVLDDIDAVVTAGYHRPDDRLAETCRAHISEVRLVGDCEDTVDAGWAMKDAYRTALDI